MAETQHGKFFKVLPPDFEKRLSIPKAFWRYLGDNLDDAIIESCQGSWPVKVGRVKDGVLAFEEGWKHFAKHHRLEEAYFLVFEHRGNMVFHVSMYDINGDEKKFPPPANGMMIPYEARKGKNPQITPSTGLKLPFFNVMMSATHRHPKSAHLTIPKAFLMFNGLSGSSNMILRRSGKEWPVKLGLWKGEAEGKTPSTRTAIRSKGWSKFYADNKLKHGDVCEFELQEVPASGEKPVIMDVYITES